MSIKQISRTSVLDAIAHGCDDVFKLAEKFEVPFFFRNLTDVVDELVADREVIRHESGLLHVNDLTEQLPMSPRSPDALPRFDRRRASSHGRLESRLR